MNNPTIRLASKEDAVEILTLICEHAKHEKEDFDPDGKLEKLQESLATVPARFTCLVVQTEEGIQGYCCYMVQFDSWYGEPFLYVDALYLRECMRGASLGKTIMAKVADEARSHGFKFLRLVTPTHNSGAIGFYRKLGGVSSEKLLFQFPV